jgi:serine phosphatase RsbU (regulator of sigma subunit)
MFGFPRLQKVVENSGGGGRLIDECLARLKEFVGREWEQEDDITLVVLQGIGGKAVDGPSRPFG